MKVALVHDYLVQYGGAERVLECFSEIFPEAPIFTILYNEKAMHGVLKDKDIRTSWLQGWPMAKKYHRLFPPLMPLAIESFDLSLYDLVISDSSSFSKGIITSPETLHISYMHTPMRYAWDDCQKYTQEFHFPSFIKKAVPIFMNYIRLWDKASADRPDKIIANSNFVRRRIQKYYRRDSQVIYPPVNYGSFRAGKGKGDYYLMVGRLIAYKKFDIAIEAFNRLGYKLKIIGRGPEMKRLKEMANGNVEFLGRVSDEELGKHYADCKAFIFPQEEDFGIVAIEAMASGRPVIAFRGGDIPEHVEEGKSGVFFENQEADDICRAVKKSEEYAFDPKFIRESVSKFDKDHFKARIKEYIDIEYKRFKSHGA